MSEKKDAPRGKASIVRKRASATRPSPVSAEMAATLKPMGDVIDDPGGLDFEEVTRIATDIDSLISPHPAAALAAPTPAPDADYDPKNLSSQDEEEPSPVAAQSSPEASAPEVSTPAPPTPAPTPAPPTPAPTPAPPTLRSSPAVVSRKKEGKPASKSPAQASATREVPVLVQKTAVAASKNATAQTPVLKGKELIAQTAAPEPVYPNLAPGDPVPTPHAALADEAPQKGWGKLQLLLGLVLVSAVGFGAIQLLGVQDSSSEEVEAPVKVANPEPAADSVGNLIKKADEQFIAGKLVGDGGALSLLVAARVANPDDRRITLRLEPLADKFQELGEAALKSGDLEEAIGHFRNCYEADPTRTAVAQKLAGIESELEKANENSE